MPLADTFIQSDLRSGYTFLLLLFVLQFGQFYVLFLYTRIAVKSKMEQTLPHKNHSVCVYSV